ADPRHDRYPDLIESQELSSAQREARFDITRLLASAALEREAGQRLRWLEQSGFLIAKVETYDSRYREASNAYEWAMPIGGHGLRFAAPRLIIASRRAAAGSSVSITLPMALERDWQLSTRDKSQPTAVLLSPVEV